MDCFHRHYRYEQKLACLLWKIDMRDVIMIPSGAPETTTTKNTVSSGNILELKAERQWVQ
jgi:guanylate cyclase